MTGCIHTPSGRYARVVPNPIIGVPGDTRLSPGLVLIETRHFEIRAVIAVPVSDLALPGHGGAPDGQVDKIRPVVAAGRVWPCTGLEFEEWSEA